MDFNHSMELSASPDQVFKALMTSHHHAELTGQDARVNTKQWARFTTLGGKVSGMNLTVIPHKKIIQSYRDESWPKDHFSTVTIRLKKADAATTVLTLLHTNVPDEHGSSVQASWKENYFDKLPNYLEFV